MKVIPIKKKQSKPLDKRLYTVQEAAQYLGRSRYSMRTLIWNGKLPVIKNGEGGKMWLDVNDMDLWIDRNKTEYAPLPGKM